MDAIWRDLAAVAARRWCCKVKGREVVIPDFRNGVARAAFMICAASRWVPATTLPWPKRSKC